MHPLRELTSLRYVIADQARPWPVDVWWVRLEHEPLSLVRLPLDRIAQCDHRALRHPSHRGPPPPHHGHREPVTTVAGPIRRPTASTRVLPGPQTSRLPRHVRAERYGRGAVASGVGQPPTEDPGSIKMITAQTPITPLLPSANVLGKPAGTHICRIGIVTTHLLRSHKQVRLNQCAEPPIWDDRDPRPPAPTQVCRPGVVYHSRPLWRARPGHHGSAVTPPGSIPNCCNRCASSVRPVRWSRSSSLNRASWLPSSTA